MKSRATTYQPGPNISKTKTSPFKARIEDQNIADVVLSYCFFIPGIGFSKKHRPRKRMAAMLAEQSTGNKKRVNK